MIAEQDGIKGKCLLLSNCKRWEGVRHMNIVKTKVCMDNGRTYEIDMRPEEFLKHIIDKKGVLINGFLYCSGVFINPQHITSIEQIEVMVSNP